MRLAIHAPRLGLSLPDQPFGKDVANRGLFTALARHGGFQQISFRTSERLPHKCLQEFFGVAPNAAQLDLAPLIHTDSAAQAGTLLRGQPYLSELAWERGYRHDHQAYSLVGIIHTLAPPKVRELIGEVLTAPVQPWDALICSSPDVRQCLDGLLDRWQSHLSQRFGGTRFPRPQLPLLPLGVDQANLLEQRADQRSRDFLRSHLRLSESDVLVLWLGRLSFFEKAYPQGMFIALQKAAQRSGRNLHFVMAGWFPGGDTDLSRYQESARRYAPNVPVHFLDGKNSDVVRCCWAAADIFLSLVDNAQETFGLAPVEAMAAGVPVVVSDWDGYRYTVTDGLEGFRIPTLAPARAQQGEELALQHDHGLVSYQDYVGSVAQHVAVDTEAAAAAIALLAEDPGLRQRMADAGRQTVRQRFDWPVVARMHHQLYAELAERRLVGQRNSAELIQHPLRADPFCDFALFSSTCLGPDTVLSLALSLRELEHRLNNLTSLDRRYEQLHAGRMDLKRLLVQLHSEGPSPLKLLLSSWPHEKHDELKLTLTWLAKLGCIHWSQPN